MLAITISLICALLGVICLFAGAWTAITPTPQHEADATEAKPQQEPTEKTESGTSVPSVASCSTPSHFPSDPDYEINPRKHF